MKREYKISLLMLGISASIPALFIMLFLSENQRIKKISLSDAEEISSVAGYSIESASVVDGSISITGWLIEVKNTILNVDRAYLLSDGSDVYRLNTVMQKREDMTEAWADGFNYDNCGIAGNGRVDCLDAGNYRIGVLLQEGGARRYYMTDAYLEVPKDE